MTKTEQRLILKDQALGEENYMENRDDNPELNSREKSRNIWILAGIVAVIVLLTVLLARFLIPLVRDPEAFREWIDQFGVWAPAVFTLLVMLQVIVAVIPGGPFEVAGGYAFGALQGTVISLIGCTMGSMLVFLLVRRYGMRIVRIFFSEKDVESMSFILDSPKWKWLLTVIFLLPGTPKDLLSYVAGLTRIHPGTWFLICSVARLPAIIVSALAGNAFVTAGYRTAIIYFLVLAAITGLGYLTFKKLRDKHSK